MFATIASTSFGGGQKAQIRRAAERRGWIDDKQFIEGLEVAELMPGANLVNLAIYIGGRMRGFPGAAAGFLGVTLPPFTIVLFVGWWYFSPYNVPATRAALAGCAAGAIGLTLANAIELTTAQGRHPVVLALIALTAFSVDALHMHLLVVLAVFGSFGIAWKALEARKSARS